MNSVILFVTGIATIIVCDFLWLGVLMADFYRTQLEPIARLKDGAFNAHLPSALIVYMCMSAGIILFVLPRVQQGSIASVFGLGAVFGLVLYGVYEFTNYAILKDWTWSVVIADTIWGMVLCGVVSVILWQLQKLLS